MTDELKQVDLPVEARRFVLRNRMGEDVLGDSVEYENAYICLYPTVQSGPVPSVKELAVDQTLTVEICLCGRRSGDRETRYTITRVV